MSDGVRVNGRQASWGSIKVRFNDDLYWGFTKLGFSDKLEVVLGFGMGAHHGPRLKSQGKYTPDLAKMTGWVASVQKLREALAEGSDSGNSYGSVEFDVIAQIIVKGQDPITIELLGCNWCENSGEFEESPDPLKEDFTFQPMKIKRNGVVLYDDSEGDPS
jgi:hypothetical protein